MSHETFDSAFQRRATLADSVETGVLDGRVLSELIQDGKAIADEAVLWDFKREIPVLPIGVKLNDAMKRSYDAKLAELVKDCVALYNTYGGYLINGVDNATRDLLGFSGKFDATDINKRIQAATNVSVETIYRLVRYADVTSQPVPLGILFIPKRPAGSKPAAFKKDAPENSTGQRAYRKDEFYFRERDICRAAKTPEDYELLFGPRLIEVPYRRKKFIENNLPARDQELKHLIGRDEEVAALWSWLPDQFNPVKILCGLGGVGKTSIAYTFAERLLYQAPEYIDKVLWLGAKTETYLALTGRFIETRLDFKTIDELLTAIILEAGCPPEQISEAPSREELMQLAQHHLLFHSYVLILDNVDTLNDDDQKKIFNLVTQLCTATKAKAILTARRNLGAPLDMYFEVKGLPFPDFQAFVAEKCKPLKVRPPAEMSDMTSLYGASGGSPLFALAILRLVRLGDSYQEAIAQWAKADGEHVRDIAFSRELKRLKANATKVVLALCYLEHASTVELRTVLGLTHADVQNALDELEEFSMTAKDTSLPGGANFSVPPMMGLITSLVEKLEADWKTIKSKCQQYKLLAAKKLPFVGSAITRTVAFLNTGDRQQALQTANAALKEMPDEPDLLCLVGRVYNTIGDLPKADENFRAAYQKGCKKRVLLEEWISLREKREDWLGVIELSKIGAGLFDEARFVVSCSNAEMMISDQSSRTGRYNEAEAGYEAAINSVQQALREYDVPMDRADLWRLNSTLVRRWLGSVRMQSKTLEGNKRFFGACFKAIKTYRLLSKDVALSGVAALKTWADAHSSDTQISERTRSDADINERRLNELRQCITSRPEFPTLSEKESGQIDTLAVDLEALCMKGRSASRSS